ncbi:MAG: isoprenylcysteine carboxylmethyltransferase family protein, partial [Acetobacteraceae bacterium]
MTPTARAAMVGVSSALYLGLAILGWGGFAAFFSHDALIGLTAAYVIVCIAALFAGGNISPGEREDRGNRWVLVAFTVLGLLNGWLPAYTDRNEIWAIDGDAVRWIGVVVFFLGSALRLWPVYVLGNRFSGLVAIQPGHKLLTSGIYSVIRHP